MLPALFWRFCCRSSATKQVPVIAVAAAATVAGTLAISATSGILLGMLAGALTQVSQEMSWELLTGRVDGGVANWCFRALPIMARAGRATAGGWLGRFLASTGPAAIGTLFVAAILPSLTLDLRLLLPVHHRNGGSLTLWLPEIGGAGHAGGRAGAWTDGLADRLKQSYAPQPHARPWSNRRRATPIARDQPSKVVHVIYLAREAGVGDAELHAFINGLNDDEKSQLTAVARVGRTARFRAGGFRRSRGHRHRRGQRHRQQIT